MKITKSVSRLTLSIILVLSMIILLVGCGGSKEPVDKVENQNQENKVDVNDKENDVDSEKHDPDKIEEPKEEKEKDIGEAFPGAEFIPVEEDILNRGKEEVRSLVSIDKALVGDKIVGYKILIKPNGHSGPMEVFSYIDMDGKIAKIEIGENEETEGIGNQVEQPEFLNRFIGIAKDEELSAIDAIAGATFSSGGTKDGIKRAFIIFDNFLK